MSLRSNIVLIGAGLLSLSAGAMAQPSASPTGSQGKFSPATRTQLQSALEKRFDAVDANHDGTLTPQERTASMAARRSDMRERTFARLDTNKDGAISKDEFTAARPQPGTERTSERGNHRPRNAGMMIMHGQFAAYADKPITRSEFVTAGLARFDRLDTNHDGTISSAERDAGRKAKRDQSAPAQLPQPLPPGS